MVSGASISLLTGGARGLPFSTTSTDSYMDLLEPVIDLGGKLFQIKFEPSSCRGDRIDL